MFPTLFFGDFKLCREAMFLKFYFIINILTLASSYLTKCL